MTSNGEYMSHIPLCGICGEYEVGTFPGGTEEYCSTTCEGTALAEQAALPNDQCVHTYKIEQLFDRCLNRYTCTQCGHTYVWDSGD